MTLSMTIRHARINSLVPCIVAICLPLCAHAQVTMAQVERDIAWLINTERAQAGLSQLATDADLAAVARAHSAEMRDKGFMGHESPVAAHKTPSDRYRLKFGVNPATLRENVSRTEFAAINQTVAQTVHMGFMNSPSHHDNIMAADISLMGIGCVSDDDGTVWTTELFSVPPPPVPTEPAPAAQAPATSAPAQPATAAATVAVTAGGVTLPVQVRIWYVSVEPNAPAQVKADVSAGDAIRWGATTDGEQMFTVSAAIPGREGLTVMPAASLHEMPTASLAGADGELILTVSAPEAVHCRIILITGSLTAVRQYGSGMRTATALTPGTLTAASLGDGGGTEVFTISNTGALRELRVSWLYPSPRAAQVSVYDELDERVWSGALVGAECLRMNLADAPAGHYTVVITAPDMHAGQGDLTIGVFPTDE